MPRTVERSTGDANYRNTPPSSRAGSCLLSAVYECGHHAETRSRGLFSLELIARDAVCGGATDGRSCPGRDFSDRFVALAIDSFALSVPGTRGRILRYSVSGQGLQTLRFERDASQRSAVWVTLVSLAVPAHGTRGSRHYDGVPFLRQEPRLRKRVVLPRAIPVITPVCAWVRNVARSATDGNGITQWLRADEEDQPLRYRSARVVRS